MPPNLATLPAELYLNISTHLSSSDIIAFRRAVPFASAVLARPEYWKNRFISDFGIEGYQYALRIHGCQSFISSEDWDLVYRGMVTQWTFNFVNRQQWGVVAYGQFLDTRPDLQSLHGYSLAIEPGSPLTWYHVFRNIRIAPGTYRLSWRFKFGPDRSGLWYRRERSAYRFNIYLYEYGLKTGDDGAVVGSRKLVLSVAMGDARGVVQNTGLFHDIIFGEFSVPGGESGHEWRMISVEIRETETLLHKFDFVSLLLPLNKTRVELIQV